MHRDPMVVNNRCQATVRSDDEEGDAALVVLEEQGFWGTLSFVN